MHRRSEATDCNFTLRPEFFPFVQCIQTAEMTEYLKVIKGKGTYESGSRTDEPQKRLAAYTLDKLPNQRLGLSRRTEVTQRRVSSHVLAASKPRRRWLQRVHKADVNTIVKSSSNQLNGRGPSLRTYL